MGYDFDMIFATNDKRSLNLELELSKRVRNFLTVEYDPVPFFLKYAAALLSHHKHRMIWWNRYQWHPLTQEGRRRRLQRMISHKGGTYDALLMWGSWFHPFKGTKKNEKPFFHYIDQSCNKYPEKYDLEHSYLKRPRTLFNSSQFLTYRDCSAVLCMSDWAKHQTLESHPSIQDEKIYTVGWGPITINLSLEPVSVSKDNKYVLFVGHEFHRKGVDILRSAIPAIVKEFPNVKFKVVGKNTDGLRVPPHPNLELLGGINSVNEMKELYRNATVFVLPHRFDRSPHVLIEAMSAGKPIITAKQGGAPEAVKNGKTGFLIDVGDVDALAKNTITLLKNERMCIAFGEQARRLMIHRYSWDSIADKILNIISKYITSVVSG